MDYAEFQKSVICIIGGLCRIFKSCYLHNFFEEKVKLVVDLGVSF